MACNPDKIMNTPIASVLEYKGSHVFSVPSVASVAGAVREMNRYRTNSILVIDGGRLMGIFTARDVLKRIIAEERDSEATLVREVMTTDLCVVTRETTVEEAMDIFEFRHCRHLPVVDGDQVVGIISIGDMARWCAMAHRAENESVRAFISTGLAT